MNTAKKQKKRVKKLKNILPSVGLEIMGAVQGLEKFKDSVEDVIDSVDEDKRIKKSRRLISIADLSDFETFERMRSNFIGRKHEVKTTNWLIYDYMTETWRIRAKYKGLPPTWCAIGSSVCVEYIDNENFKITTEIANIIYNNSNKEFGEIKSYEMKDY